MIINIIEDFFKEQSWQYTHVQDNEILMFGINGHNGNFQCLVSIHEAEKRFTFLSICGANAPNEKKTTILKLINQLNFRIFLGAFEMDEEDGEIRFKTCFSYKNFEPSKNVIAEYILTNISTMDNYLPNIMEVIYGD